MLPIPNVTLTKCNLYKVYYTKCYLDKMLLYENVLYMTDPKLFCLKPKICAKVCKKKSRKSYANFEHTLWSFRVNTTSFISCM